MTENTDRAKAWLDGLAARGIRVRLRENNLEISPRSSYGTLTNDELLTLNDFYFRASIKSLLRNEWQSATTEFCSNDSATHRTGTIEASPQDRPSPQAPIDTAGTSFAPQTSPGEAVSASEPRSLADLTDAPALDFSAKEKARPSLSPQAVPDEPPDPERTARLRIVAANTQEEIDRRNAIAVSIMLHGLPTGHRDWS